MSTTSNELPRRPRPRATGRLRVAVVALGVLASVTVLALVADQGWPVTGASPTSALPDADPLEPQRPILGVPSGYHPAPFELELRPPRAGQTIIYTLDGSTPDLDRNPGSTRRYDGPIPIDPERRWPPGATPLSIIDTAIPGVVPGWRPIDDAVHHIAVLRARVPGGPERTASYLIGPELLARELGVISLQADPDHLFDPERGIYVPGDLAEGAEPGHPDLRDWELPANFIQRGRDWERPASDDLDRPIVLEHCAPETGCDHRQQVGVRIHGNFSRSRPQKSLRLYARSEYGHDRFDHDLFVGAAPTGHRRLLLRNSGNDFQGTMLLDSFLQSLLGDLTADTQASRPVVVYLNGEYWGIHNLRERYDPWYLEVVHGADPDRVVLLDELLEVSAGPEDGAEPYHELLEALEASPRLTPALRDRLDAELDIASFLDLVLAHVVVGNWDWPSNNTALWRELDGPDRPGEGVRDGRWRWLVYDLDHMGERRGRYNVDYDVLSDRLAPSDTLRTQRGYPLLFERVMQDPAWREWFLNRAADLLSTSFAPAHSTAALDELAARYRPEITLHRQRWWPTEADDSRWERDIAGLRGFLQQRPRAQYQHLIDRFELAGTATLTVIPDLAGGAVTVNEIDLHPSTPGVSASGTLMRRSFLGVPVPLRATPRPGHRFVGWEDADGRSLGTDHELVVTPTADLTIRARFAPG